MSERWSVAALTAILDALERELIEAPEAEIAAVLRELGLRPDMPGSVALFELVGRYCLAEAEAPDKGKDRPVPTLHFLREFRRPS